MNSKRLCYLMWSLLHSVNCDLTCPFCHSASSRLVRRKAVVTALYECENCGLRFRVPKDDPESSARFYQTKYSQVFTTDCPSDVELAQLVQSRFRHSPKDYAEYVKVLNALDLRPGDSILDFGCSWGYGSWQLRDAGFRVYSYEISRPRAEYAACNLACDVVNDLRQLPERVKCFFSAHVIEHLPDPNAFWNIANQVLRSDGFVVCFAPNGEPHLERIRSGYDHLWGQVHPLLLNHRALESMARHYGFSSSVFSSPYSDHAIRQRNTGTWNGEELLLVARRP